jgi:Probable zinc-ribbon domain
MSERERRRSKEFDETWDAERFPDPTGLDSQLPPETASPPSDFKDLIIRCVDCGADFDFTVADHNFFSEKIGKDYKTPKRCKVCRANKRRQQAERTS